VSEESDRFMQGLRKVGCIIHSSYTAEPSMLLPLHRLVRPIELR
jgi:hypothetical protein